MAENYIDAERDYMQGAKYKDIAAKYDVTINTVKSWKQRYSWSREKGVHTKNNKVCTQRKKDAPQVIEDGTRETLQNDELTTEQQLFCIYYNRTFNATQSYKQAYGCSYASALTNGSRLLGKAHIKAEIQRLKEIKRQQVVAGAEDIVELQMRIAFSDIGNLVKFDKGSVLLEDSGSVDTQLVKKVKKVKEGVSLELEDRQKAIDWLTKYFLIHPDDKYRAEFDRKKAEAGESTEEEIATNMQTLAEVLQHSRPNRNIEDYEEE